MADRSLLEEFRRRFWQPPRAHGDVIQDRSVSFLELFYDLAYVVVIGRTTHHLAGDLSWHALGEFAVLFTMIWVAWLNGTLYIELHGREDGRTRSFVFVQMLVLAVLAVFTEDAAGETGGEFAVAYTIFLVVLTWMWWVVREQDDDPEMRRFAGNYLVGMVAAVVVIGSSALFEADVRIFVWAAFFAVWLFGILATNVRSQVSTEGLEVSESLVERFGLFVIIVLGEVVLGVVSGLSDVEHATITIATGLIGLGVGFGFWWTYFDAVGGRLPRNEPFVRFSWMFGHLPVVMAIAASGAAMVGLIEHAADDRAPAAAAWLLTGSVAFGLLALVGVVVTLRDFERLRALYGPVSGFLVAAATAVLFVGWIRPAPWVMTLAVVVVLGVLWFSAVVRSLRIETG